MPVKKFPENNDSGSVINGLPRPQKTAVIVLAALAVLIVVFWVWQMKSNINRPFASSDKNTKFSATSTDINYILNNQDTDNDGLSDYDEIYTYKTSPYLEDSDSDGIFDKKEVDQNTDPNCPQGQNCNAATEPVNSSSQTGDLNQNPETNLPSATGLNAVTTDQTILQNAMSGQIDVATLRQLLLSSGASKADLDKISDEDLMKSYQETLNKQGQNGTSTKTSTSNNQ